MPLIRIAHKVGDDAPIGRLPPQHPPKRPQRQRAGSEPAPEQIEGEDSPQSQLELQDRDQDQDRDQVQRYRDPGVDGDVDQDEGRDQDAENRDRNREGSWSSAHDKEAKAKESAKAKAKQEDDDFLAKFLPFGIGQTGVSAPKDLSLEAEETDPGEGDGPGDGDGKADHVTTEPWFGVAGDKSEVEPAKAKGRGKPVTSEDDDIALASFAGQELGRQSGRVRRARTGSIIPRPQLQLVRPEPPKPKVPDWFKNKINAPQLPRRSRASHRGPRRR